MRLGMRLCWLPALVWAACSTCFAAIPQIASYPQVSASTLVADDTTAYTLTAVASDGDGYNDIKEIRILFDYTESGGVTSAGRGYWAWGISDAQIARYGGTWIYADSGGFGRYAYRTDAWGSDTYNRLISCSASTSGKATGGTGTVTVTFTFTAKPAWAMNPLMNDADIYTADATVNVGWKDNPVWLDVVAAPCASYCADPRPPVVLGSTGTSISFAIDPSDSDADVYAILVSPRLVGKEYVQADGTLGAAPVFQTKAQWGSKTITGLASDLAYSLKARAARNEAGVCPSQWSTASVASTSIVTRPINWYVSGSVINKGVMGMDAQPKVISAQLEADNLAASLNTSMRCGGDGYNWKTLTAQWNSGTQTTLTRLRQARDRNSWVVNLTNTRGIGTGNGSTWVYTDYTSETLAALAADWVFYCNNILQNRRQGDTLTTREQAVLDSMLWGTQDKLLAPGEAPVAKVQYWEIGNEPEGPYPPPVLTPQEYGARYKAITQAVLAEDPLIKVGPCVMSADNGNAWLDAVLSDQTNQVDMVCYHPYGSLYWITRSLDSGILNADDLNLGLNGLKQSQSDRRQKVVDRLTANGRPSTTPLMATEFNPSSWEGTYYFNLHRTVAHALGLCETIFAFAQLGFLGAQYWDLPNNPSTTSIEAPGFKVFKEMQAYMGDLLLEYYDEPDFRIYQTLDAETGRLIVWALNFSEYNDKRVRFTMAGDTRGLTINQHRLAAVAGDTSLILKNMSSDPSEKVQWIRTDLTGTIDPADFTITFPRATMTMIRIDRPTWSILLLPNGTPVSLSGKSVTAVPSTSGMYIEEDDRSYGIRIAGNSTGFAVGDRVNVVGTMNTSRTGSIPYERYILATQITKVSSDSPLEPVSMTNRELGGEATPYIVGVKDGIGMSNIGLLVTVWGRVTQMGSGYLYIDDGENLKDSTVTGTADNVGIRVLCNSTGYSPGDFLIATGISACFRTPYAEIARQLRTRTSADIIKLWP